MSKHEMIFCEECGELMRLVSHKSTCWGYLTNPMNGCCHDANIETKDYKCFCGYSKHIDVDFKCPNPSCNWTRLEARRLLDES